VQISVTLQNQHFKMELDLISSILMGGGYMVLILSVGFLLLAVANVPLSLRELKASSSFLLSRPFIDLNISLTTWVLMGWALANGGDIGLFLGTSEYATIGVASYELWFFQSMLLYLSVVVFSNATLSRQINGYARSACVLFYSLVVFPILYHFLWSVGGWASPYRSSYKEDLLIGCGVIDSAGASIIHMSSGCVGLILLWLVEPREHRPLQSESDVKKPIAKSEKKEGEEDVPLRTESKKPSVQIGEEDRISLLEKEKKDHLSHLSHEKSLEDIPLADFKTRQLYANISAPVLIWLGFLGLNVITNLPGNNISNIAGKRFVICCA
jgi:ammonium transporter, Amt family